MPYDFHLMMVVEEAKKFLYLIPQDKQETVLAACWVHDCVEDCRQTYNDVRNATTTEVAEIAYALTNEKGKNRKERANDKYYTGIRNTPYATFVKLCDRIANVKYSFSQNGRMLELYRKENEDFLMALTNEREHFEYADLIVHLKSLFELSKEERKV